MRSLRVFGETFLSMSYFSFIAILDSRLAYCTLNWSFRLIQGLSFPLSIFLLFIFMIFAGILSTLINECLS